MNQNLHIDYHLSFLKGIFYLWQPDYEQAKQHFFKAFKETDALDSNYPVYHSYLGLSEVLNQKKSGLHNCYQSSETNPNHVEIQLNLVCAELYSNHRRRAMKVLEHIARLHLSHQNDQIIQSLFKLTGHRTSDKRGSLKRDRLMHRSMGKMLRKKEEVNPEQIESFIKETVKIRYERIIVELYKNDPAPFMNHIKNQTEPNQMRGD